MTVLEDLKTMPDLTSRSEKMVIFFFRRKCLTLLYLHAMNWPRVGTC